MRDTLRRVPFLRMLLPLLAGLGVAPCFSGVPHPLWLFIAILLWSMAWGVSRHPAREREGLEGLSLTLFFVVLGIFLGLRSRDVPTPVSGDRYLATLLEQPYSKNGRTRAEALLTAALDGEKVIPAREKILVYFPEGYAGDSAVAGSRILFGATPAAIVNRGNPYEFDFRGYAADKGFYRQLFLAGGPWQMTGSDPRFRLRVAAEKTRDALLTLYQRNGLHGAEFDILAALTLGYKKSLDTEIRQVFSSTGASHVLAVSGLHTGIVYLILSFFLGFLRRGRFTRILFPVVSVAALWVFAFITGLAPSVQRSALMFSVVVVGDNLRRPVHIWNTLSASAFLLLVINPRLTGDVGFQLSYAAVAGIVFFQPRISALLRFRHRLPRYFWELLAVSLASQITTFPLSCHYFHQFPVYFWISNFVVIPAAFVFISLGILVLVTSVVAPVSSFLAQVTGILVHGVYLVLENTASLPGALIPGIGFPQSSLVLAYGVLLAGALFLVKRKAVWLHLSLGAAVLLFLAGAAGRWYQAGSREIIAYNRREPVIHLIAGFRNYLLLPRELMESGDPLREAAAVTLRCRLLPPVMVPLEEDYHDRFLLKKGPLFSFGGILAEISDGRRSPSLPVTPDVLFLTGRGDLPSFPEEVQVVSYRRAPTPQAGSKYHRVNEMGAWRRPLPHGPKK